MTHDSPTPRTRPSIDPGAASDLVLRYWGHTAEASELAGDIDRNFRLRAADGTQWFLKVARTHGGDVPLAVRQEAADRVAATATALVVPASLAATDGRRSVAFEGVDGALEAVLTEWIDAIPLADFRPHDGPFLDRLGQGMAEASRALSGVEHPSLLRTFDWELRQAPGVIGRERARIADPGRGAVLDRLLSRWHALSERAVHLPEQTIHGDANDYNVFVGRAAERPQLFLIDFGDMARSWRIADLAIAAAYAVMDTPDPVGGIAAMAAGWSRIVPITEAEADALPVLVALRLGASVTLSAARSAAEPDDPYLVVSERPAWDLLGRLDAVHPRLAAARVRAACGLDPSPAGSAVAAWISAHGGKASPVLQGWGSPPPIVLDLSPGSVDFDETPEFADVDGWQRLIDRQMQAFGADRAVGRYLEPRLCYGAVQFAGDGVGDEPQRTVHLGIDLFAPAGTPVHAPLQGVVESVADHDRPLDYGPTVILRHPAEEGRPEFRTLYGHLGRSVVGGLMPGRVIRAGEPFAVLGASDENGEWPPHLHFQVLADDLDRTDGDFPGVAFPREASSWAGLCPDPSALLGLGAEARHASSVPGDLEARRRALLSPNLSVSYRRPIHVVRGVGPYLFDSHGRRYLDGVNNVCHVGHAHPRVVRAARRQMAVLNTNTRYLHESIERYAEALLETLPDPLEVCFFVNSGSEANDLALRLARAATGRKGVVAVEVGYHGNLTSLIDISSYKFDGPGGAGRPDHVRLARRPDPYRGALRGIEPDLGARYAEDVRHAAAELEAAGLPPAAFIAEAILSCGGQVVPPPGWLPEAARHAREAGAVYIADEVQTGFGRVGSHWWAFEAQGAVPDIVTMGKPIGNGHPIGAVATTRAIAESFSNGMEYFNTYGGNPVSCAVGLEVLDVVRSEGLRELAAASGRRLIDGLRALAADRPLIGDVRGMGLFLGFELVLDPERKDPAPIEASYLVNRVRDLGVLLSTDGPDHNVIKIKPPLVFGEAEVDQMLDVLRTVFDDTCLSTRPAPTP